MRTRSIALIAATALGAASGLFAGQAQAAPMAPSGILAGTDAAGLVQNVQLFVFGGRQYCWYDRGWNGPGWYWCGYAFRRGAGWGGAYGWHGWVRHERREERREERHERREEHHERREDRRERRH